MPQNREFSIYESILWKEGEFTLLEYHLRRMKASASELGFRFREENFLAALEHACGNICNPGIPAKVRVFLARDGTMRGDAEGLSLIATRNIKIWGAPVDPDNPFLYHKTTVREHYGAAAEMVLEEGLADVLFYNTRGEMTEGTRANFFWREGETLFTPPVSCGLLPGTYRQSLLDLGIAREEILLHKDIGRAEKIYIGNSVRGLIEGRF